MTIYDLLRLLIDDSSIEGKSAAHELIRTLEQSAAFGTFSSVASVEGAGHVHVPQQEWENELCQRYIRRCATCRTDLCEAWWPEPKSEYRGQYFRR